MLPVLISPLRRQGRIIRVIRARQGQALLLRLALPPGRQLQLRRCAAQPFRR